MQVPIRTGRVEDDRARNDHEGDTLGQEAGADMDGPRHCEKADLTPADHEGSTLGHERDLDIKGNIRGCATTSSTKKTGRVEGDRARDDHEGDFLGQEAGAAMAGPRHCIKTDLTRSDHEGSTLDHARDLDIKHNDSARCNCTGKDLQRKSREYAPFAKDIRDQRYTNDHSGSKALRPLTGIFVALAAMIVAGDPGGLPQTHGNVHVHDLSRNQTIRCLHTYKTYLSDSNLIKQHEVVKTKGRKTHTWT